MRYYLVSNLRISELENYVIKQNETNDVFLFSFHDDNLDDIAKNVDRLIFIDENKKHYIIDNYKVIATGDKFSWTAEKWYNKFCKIYSNLHKEEMQMQLQLKKCKETAILKQGLDIGSFKSYLFGDKENEFAYPFRLKRCKGKEKQPLVIFFCGAGSVGNDNFKPLIESIPMQMKLKKHNCNVLIPQPLTSINYNSTTEEFNLKFDAYINSIHHLVNLLIQNEVVDADRIYVFGTSLGGCCTWRFVYNFPAFCACAMPVIGKFDLSIENSNYADFKRISHLPMWVAHSSDDKIIDVKFDDFAVSELKKYGSDVRYIRWDKYGHGMAGRFYHKEDWCNWMFKQSKNHK